MVFESIVADVLNRFLCRYVENVDQSQLQIGIWGGDVVLEKLVLKEGALDELDLPIRTTYGRLGKLVLKIPWKNLYTAPVVILIERLFILAVPNRDVVYDPVKEENWKQEAKENELKRVEEAKKREKARNAPKLDDTFVEKLVTQIIKNVQIQVNDIHIRYEDRISNIDKPFSIGVTLDYFYVHTTDANWKDTVIQDNVTKVNKVAEIDSLAIYWNCRSRLFKERNSHEIETITQQFQETICTKNYLPLSFHYIFGPINATMQLLLNSKPELDNFQIPKFEGSIHLNTFALGINKFQYHDMIRLAESLNRMAVSASYRKYRPHLNVYRGHCEVWWKFAYTCILEEFVRRSRDNWRWTHISQHRERCRNYATLYQYKLIAGHASKELEAELKELERDIDVFNIILIRERVEMELEKAGLLPSATEDEEGWLSWLNSFQVVRWFKNTPQEVTDNASSSTVQRALENAMTPKEKAKLYKAIGYKEHSGPIYYPLQFVGIRIHFNMDSFQVKITDNLTVQSRVLLFQLSTVTLDFEQRPAHSGIKVNMSILTLTVYGLEQGNVTPMMVVSKDHKKNIQLLDMLFELNPFDEECDQRLHLNFRTLQIVYDARTIQKLVDIFRAPHLRSFHQLHDHLENVKNMSAIGLQYTIEQHSALELKVDIKASHLIVPHSGLYAHQEDILVMNLGHVKINSFPRSMKSRSVRALVKKGISLEGIMKTMISQSYDKFILNLDDMQVLIALKGEDWEQALEQNKATPLHVLEPMSLVIIYNQCLIKDDPKIPKIKITATIAKVTINITNVRLLNILVLLSSLVPKTYEEDEESKQSDPEEITANEISSFDLVENNWNVLREKSNKQSISKTMNTMETSVDKAQAIKMDLTFTVEQLTVQGYLVRKPTTTFCTATKFISIYLIKIELEMVEQTFNIDIVARLGGIFADVFILEGAVRVIDTPMATAANVTEYLVTINFITVDKKSPELHIKHNNTLKFLQIEFSTLHFLLHQEVLLHLNDVITTFILQLQKELGSLQHITQTIPTSKHWVNETHRKVEVRMQEKSTAVTQTRRRLEYMMQVETSLRLQVDMSKFKITIANCAVSIADISIEGCYIKATFMDPYSKFAIRLETIQVLDCYHKSLHPRTLSVLGDETLSIELIKYNVEKLFSIQRERHPDILLSAKIACVRIVYLNRFFSALLTFFNNVKSVKTLFFLDTTVATVASVAKQNLKEMVDSNYIRINIDLDAPILIIPINSKSLIAIMLDFGFLTIHNEHQTLDVVNKNGTHALLDYIVLNLQNLTVNRVKLTRDYNVVSDTSLLQPISFFIEIERNLSLSWHTSIPACNVSMRLQVLNVTLTQEDYKTIMMMVHQNFSETYVVTSGKKVANLEGSLSTEILNPSHHTLFASENVSDSKDETPNKDENNDSEIVTFKFSFFVDSIIVNLYTGGAVTLDDTSQKHSSADLARFSLQSLCLNILQLSNGKSTLIFRMINCVLDDTREGRAEHNIRLMQRKDGTLLIDDDFQDDLEFPRRSFVDISYISKNTETFVDVYVHGFQFIVSVEYLNELKEFFLSHRGDMYTPEDNTIQPSSISLYSYATSEKPSRVAVITKQISTMLVNVKFEKLDIVIVESVDDPDNNAFIMSCEIVSKINNTRGKMYLNASITDLQLISCCFNPLKRKNTTALVLRPCIISILGSTPIHGDLNLDVCITDVRVGLSPGTIHLFRTLHTAVYGSSVKLVATEGDETDHSDIWKPREIGLLDDELRFIENRRKDIVPLNVIKPVSDDDTGMPSNQICVISAPSLVVTVEAGEGKWRQPLIFVQIKVECIVYDWSSNLLISSNLALQIEYYNSSLTSWEPLIEPLEKIVNNKLSGHFWELKADLRVNSEVMQSSSMHMSPKIEGSLLPQPIGLSINISSQDKLELTLTKTCIEVLRSLSNVFFEASSSSVTSGALAPYTVKNMSGLVVTVILSDGPFRLSVVHGSNRHHEVTLHSGAQIGLCLAEEEIPPTDAMGSEMSDENDSVITKRFLTIRVAVDTDHSVIIVPVFRCAMRYFSLKHCGENGDQLGLLWEVKICEGSTILTLRGIIQIHNHLKEPIHIYYFTKLQDRLVHVGAVQPDDELYLPLHSIYTPTSELLFSAKGYKVTKEAFMWKDLNRSHTISKLLRCSTLNPLKGEPFIFNVVGFKKQLYYENTFHYTPESTVYDIHLHPAVMIKNFLPVDTLICINGLNIKEELLIKAGKQMQMVNVEPGISMMSIKIPNYLDKEWLSMECIHWNTSTFDVSRLISKEKNQQEVLEIRIYTRETTSNICKHLSCQFWMLNKTGLNLAYRQCDEHENTCKHDKNFKDPVLFSFWGATNANKKVSLMISNGEWSDKFSLDAAGSSGVVNCKVERITHYVGVQVSFTQSKLTKQVTFIPYYVLVNNHKVSIECREADQPDDHWVNTEPGDCTPFWPRSTNYHKELLLRIENSTEISVPFSCSSVHTTLIKLDNKYGAVFVDVHKTEGAIYVNFWPYKPGLAPTVLINHTWNPIHFWEQDEEENSVLNPKEMVLFTWKKPTGSRIVTYRLWKKGELSDSLQSDGVHELSSKSGERVYWVSFLDGLQRTTLFTSNASLAFRVRTKSELESIDTEITLSINSIGISFVDNTIFKEILYMSFVSSDILWETRKSKRSHFKPLPNVESQMIERAFNQFQADVKMGREAKRIFKLGTHFEVDLATKEVIRPPKRYLRRTFQEGVWFRVKTSRHQITMHGKINRLQIDNQMSTCVFPVVFAPVPPPKTVEGNQRYKAFAECSIVRRYMEHSPVKYYKYFKILIQAFHVKVEMDFVNALGILFDWENVPEHVEALQFADDMELAREPLLTNVTSISSQDEKNFYDILHFSPLKIHLSFSLSLSSETRTKEHTLPLVMVILHGLGVTLTDFHDVVLKLGCFERNYTFLTQKEMISEVTSHYTSQFLKQTYVLVLGLDLIGNPWGLLMDIRQAVTDLFYEPYHGVIQGPEEFGEGLLLGLRSAFGTTVGGTFGAASNISGAIGTGIAVLTFDQDFQHRRRGTKNQVPHNVQARLVRGGKDLVMGVADGVSGLVAQPISGAHRNGVTGFFKGMGKGLLGLVVRPAVGLFDFISNSLGVVTTGTDKAEICRVRPSRYLSPDGLVRPYVRAEAEGNLLLQTVEKGRFVVTDLYEYHLSGINGTKDSLLLTNKRIMYIHVISNIGYFLAWEYTWDTLKPPSTNKEGILIISGTRKRKWAASSSSHGKGTFIPIKSHKQRKFLVKKIQELRER